MNTLNKAFKSFWKDEDGLEMVEYAVIGALILVGAITGFTAIGGSITTTLATISNAL